MTLRIFAFILLSLTALLAPLPAFLFCALLYVFFWEAYELLMIGVVIDSVFGTTSTSFLYIGSIGALLVVFTFIRPYLSWYKTTQT